MPPHRTPEGYRMVALDLPIELVGRLKELAGVTRRPFKEEVLPALERHLAAPPQVLYQMDTPPLSPEVVRVEEPPPKKRRGRK